MGPHLVVVPPPLLDADAGIDGVAEPLQAEALVAELPIEGFVGGILPGLTWTTPNNGRFAESSERLVKRFQTKAAASLRSLPIICIS